MLEGVPISIEQKLLGESNGCQKTKTSIAAVLFEKAWQ